MRYASPKKFGEKYGLMALSFAMPALLISIAFAANGIYPAGSGSILIIDNHHQYTPFLMEFSEMLREGRSMMYSWNGGLGANFMARYAYYLSSPLNFFSVFFPKGMMIEFLLGLVIFRTGLSGLTFFVYLKNKFNNVGVKTIVFSCMYALSAYVLAYYWNVMWFDVIALFPIVVLGLERLVDENRGFIYCAALAISIISNFYIGLMVCIFCVIYFIIYYLSQNPGFDIKKIMNRTLFFIIFSLWAGAITAVVTLPAYFGLTTASAASTSFSRSVRLYEDVLDIFSNHLMLVKPSIMVGLPNIYCGVVVFFLAPLHLLNRKIHIREKICNTLLLLFMVLSFNVNILDYLWHGMHFPNSLLFRFSFMYIFVLLAVSCHALSKLDGVRPAEIFACAFGAGIFIFYMERQPSENTETLVTYISMLFIIIYSLVIFGIRHAENKAAEMVAGICENATADAPGGICDNANTDAPGGMALDVTDKAFVTERVTSASREISMGAEAEGRTNICTQLRVGAESEPESQSKSATESKSKTEVKSESESESKSESTLESKSESESESESGSGSESKADEEISVGENADAKIGAITEAVREFEWTWNTKTGVYEKSEPKVESDTQQATRVEYAAPAVGKPESEGNGGETSEAESGAGMEHVENAYPKSCAGLDSAAETSAYMNEKMWESREKHEIPKGDGSRRVFVAGAIFLIIVAIELCINACYRIGEAGIFQRDNYVSHLNEVMPAVERVKAMEVGFERIEFAEQTTYNTPVIYNYKGVSYYSSTSQVKVNDLFGQMGFINSNAWYVYRSNTPVIDSILSVKYILNKDRDLSNGIYRKLGEEGEVRIYENPYFLPIGFMVNSDVANWNYNANDPFQVQQDFINKALGSNIRVFRDLQPEQGELDNMQISSGGGTHIRYARTDAQKEASATYKVTVKEGGQAYIFVDAIAIEDVKVTGGGFIKNHNVRYPYIMDCGSYSAGESFEVLITFKADVAGDSFAFYAYSFDEEAFRRAYERLRRQVLRDVEYTDVSLKARIDVIEKGVLFTSIPLDGGWTVKVDGAKYQKESVGGGAFLALELDKGMHEIEFVYFTTGLLEGIVISSISILLLIAAAVMFRRVDMA
ncbi:MAG: YfhO family protein [Synergistaceae bacterium]|nr:YfhO family protein [Synergistaceae bacterium]